MPLPRGESRVRPWAVLAALMAALLAPCWQASAQRLPPVSPPVFSTIFFDWESSTLKAADMKIVHAAAAEFRRRVSAIGSAHVTVTGHADTSHDNNPSLVLSFRRAGVVRDALVADGVPKAAIAIVGKGSSQLLVRTAPGVREPKNRRAEIVFQ